MVDRPQFSAEEFFKSQREPAGLELILTKVEQFILENVAKGKRVVLVTSGGTTVPLEHNVVRFLDNFSAGTRGSSSAEHFLKTGEYAVIFLHRQFSLQPFSRHFSHSKGGVLDLLEFTEGSEKERIEVGDKGRKEMIPILREYQKVKSANLLHSIPFVTVDEYLFMLRGISKKMGNVAVGRRGMFYLAAAVSDFFIPTYRMSEHKIQSGKGSLTIEMDQVPKILGFVEEWSNNGYIVSFKLETDLNLLIPKSKAALERYGHSVVIGNTLTTRKHEVVFVEKDSEDWLRIPENIQHEIEVDIVARLVDMHSNWIGK